MFIVLLFQIQSRWRAFTVRRKFQRMRESAVVVQSYMRRLMAKREADRIRQERSRRRARLEAAEQRSVAVLVVQRSVRKWLFRRRTQRALETRANAALTIQAFWRGCRRVDAVFPVCY